MPSTWQIQYWKENRLKEFRAKFVEHDHLVAAAVACKLAGQGCTVDDELTERRWVFNKHGELIATRAKRGISHHSHHAWQPGIRDRVDIA